MKYWFRLMCNSDSSLYEAYINQCTTLNTTCWASKLNSIVDHLGLTNLRLNFDRSINSFQSVKQRLRDQFSQNWRDSINGMSKLDSYCKFKLDFCLES